MNHDSADEAIMLAAAAVIVCSESRKRRKPRFWEGPLVKKRPREGLLAILECLKESDIGLDGELR